MKPLSGPPKLFIGYLTPIQVERFCVTPCGSVVNFSGLAWEIIAFLDFVCFVLFVVRVCSLRRDFVADSRYRFFNVFPIAKSAEAEISFTGGAKT